MPKNFNRYLMAVIGIFLTITGHAQQVRIDLQGHRGARWLLPENTLPSFKKALEYDVTTLELDVVVTSDEVLVIHHDPALNPALTRDNSGKFLQGTGPMISSLTFSELQKYDVGRLNIDTRYARNFPDQVPVDGQKIPKLSDLFEMVKASGNTRVKFAIETKVTPLAPRATPSPERMADLLVNEIIKHELIERVQILSFDWRSLRHIQKKNLNIPTVFVTAQLKELNNIMADSWQGSPWTAGFQFKDHGSIPKMIKAAGGTHWSSFWRELDASKVQEAQSLGIKVLAWTINDPVVFEQMLDIGVDGIVTDRPDMAVEILKRRKIEWTPQ